MDICRCTVLSCAVLLTVSTNISAGQTLTFPSAKYSSIAVALAEAQDGDTVLVADGVYGGNLYLNPGTLMEAKNPGEATLKGKGRGVIVTLASNAHIEGFVIEDGTIGIFSSCAGTAISQCRISGNTQSGIMCIGHLPSIRDNIIVYNKGSGIQGWDVRSTTSGIDHNTIAFNENHGLAFDGASDIIINDNLVAFNGQFGLKYEPATVRLRLRFNNFFRNGVADESLPPDNFSYDPAFADPQHLKFTLGKDSKCRSAGSDRKRVGARYPVE